MCGIAGVFGLGGRLLTGADRAAADAMAAAQQHRGPDRDTVGDGSGYALRFARLAVNALTDGDQPFEDPHGRWVTVVNGEIYNHVELRRRHRGPVVNASDCAVVADLASVLGEALFGQLRGMFAVVLLDRHERRVHLVRDPFGIKPLFWSVRGDRLYVASELKGLFASGRVPAEPDWAAVLTGSVLLSARRGTLRDDLSHFRYAEAVPPGGVVSVDLDTGAVRTSRYHEWTIGAGPLTNASDYVEEYRRLLVQAVDRACLADTPVTVLLSGGVDSLAVAALAAGRRALTAWTVLAPPTEPVEHPAAARAAQALGIPLSWADTRAAERHLGLADWCWLLRRCETPLAGPEQYYKLAMLHAARDAGDPFTVVLTGQGSDEFNGGYAAGFSHTPPGGWAGFLDALELGRHRHALDRMPGAVRALGGPLPERWLRLDWLRAQVPALPADPYEYWISAMLASLQQYNCWHEDRDTAAYSAETRPVFLDVDLVAHALSVPASLRADLLWDKRILRDAVRPLLPAALTTGSRGGLVQRPKAPFHMQADRRTALAVVVGLLDRDGDDLVELATCGPTAKAVLEPAALCEGIRRVLADPDLTDLDHLLRLLSLGALETLLAADAPATPPGAAITELAIGGAAAVKASATPQPSPVRPRS
jgi:asparagine synthase (glutamine-hydrolysing)